MSVHAFDHYWPDTLARELTRAPCALITVLEVRGSAPRPVGARMLITEQGQHGSIGGGNLEYRATAVARELLADESGEKQRQVRFGLGPELNQCCGGAVTLLIERITDPGCDWLQHLLSQAARGGRSTLITALEGNTVNKVVVSPDTDRNRLQPALRKTSDQRTLDGQAAPDLVRIDGDRYLLETPRDRRLPLSLFGAGHVARAFAQLAELLPLRLRWIDSRQAEFPAWATENAEVLVSQNPVAEVAASEAGSLYLVMTHSHELDEEICHAVLQRGDAAWLGLIGSNSKRRRFVHRLAKRGHSQQALDRLVCPVGAAGIRGKRPATIALSIAAQLLAEQVPEDWR